MKKSLLRLLAIVVLAILAVWARYFCPKSEFSQTQLPQVQCDERPIITRNLTDDAIPEGYKLEENYDVDLWIIDKNCLPQWRTLKYAGTTEDTEILLIYDETNKTRARMWTRVVVNGKGYVVDSEDYYYDWGSTAYNTSIGTLFKKVDLGITDIGRGIGTTKTTLTWSRNGEQLKDIHL